MQRLFVCAVLAACSHGADPVVGPFTGEPRHFIVDRIELPRTSTEAREMGDDLTGDGVRENQLGSVFGALAGQAALNEFSADIIAAGAIHSRVVIVADDLANDGTVGISYLGVDGAIVSELGGTLIDGTLVTNRTRSSDHGGTAVVRLPVFRDADPSTVDVLGAQLELVPDGNGGFDGRLQGVVRHEQALELTFAGIAQQLETAPRDHLGMWESVDLDLDGIVTREELTNNTLIASLLAPDLRIGGGDTLSLGFEFHIAPCTSEIDCPIAVPADTCFDRVHDGDETALDCGGSCKPCAGANACNVDEDCQSAACTGNVCEAASCTDGVLSKFEIDVDCGRTCGVGCGPGLRCDAHDDCASGGCSPNGHCF